MPQHTHSWSGDLKEDCIDAAREFIATRGVEQLSLRDVARQLGVSHQAPYKHYPSKDHLLAEVMRRCFEEFAQFLDAREQSSDPLEDLHRLGLQYQVFAERHPVEYRLMFGTPWPQHAEQTNLVKDATHAFDVLRTVLTRLYGTSDDRKKLIDSQAMFIWVNMHGLASIRGSIVTRHLGLADDVSHQLTEHVMTMISVAMANAGELAP